MGQRPGGGVGATLAGSLRPARFRLLWHHMAKAMAFAKVQGALRPGLQG